MQRKASIIESATLPTLDEHYVVGINNVVKINASKGKLTIYFPNGVQRVYDSIPFYFTVI